MPHSHSTLARTRTHAEPRARTYDHAHAAISESAVIKINVFDYKAAATGLEVNWDKTKVQALGTHQLDTETLDVYGHQVAVVDEFVYLGALTHSSVLSCYDIHRRSGLCDIDFVNSRYRNILTYSLTYLLTHSAMQKSDNCIWKSRLSLGSKRNCTTSAFCQ